MAKKQKQSGGNGGRNFFLFVLIVILIAALAGGVYAAYRYTDGFTHFPWQTQQPGEDPGKEPGETPGEDPGTDPGVIKGDYYLELDGTQYGNNGVARLVSGSTFTVGAGFGSDYSVAMTARSVSNDFEFTLGAEPYKWSNVVGDDFTAGFTITKGATGFTVEFGTLEEIIAAAKGNAVTIADDQITAVGNKFVMTVTAANGTAISVTFTNSAQSIVIDPDHVIFGGEDQGGSGTPEEPTQPEEPMSENAKQFVELVETALTDHDDALAAVDMLAQIAAAARASDIYENTLAAEDKLQPDVINAKSALDILMTVATKENATAEEWNAAQESAREILGGSETPEEPTQPEEPMSENAEQFVELVETALTDHDDTLAAVDMLAQISAAARASDIYENTLAAEDKLQPDVINAKSALDILMTVATKENATAEEWNAAQESAREILGK